jgi:hypothetical protein
VKPPNQRKQGAPFGRWPQLTLRPCCRRYMAKVGLKTLALLITLLLSVTCSASDFAAPHSYPAPSLKPTAVEGLAREYLRENEIHLDGWSLESLTYDFLRRDWVLTFFPTQENPPPGLVTIRIPDGKPNAIEYFPAK